MRDLFLRFKSAPSVPPIQLGDFEIKLSRKPIKNMNLRIDAHGNIHLSAPPHTSMNAIRLFLEHKHAWITKHHALIQAQTRTTNPEFVDGETQVFLGKPYALVLYQHLGPQHIMIKDNNIVCYTHLASSKENTKKLFMGWYRSQLQELLPSLIANWAPVIGVQVNEWRIKVMKTRWGTCNTKDRRIWFNLHLIQKPLASIEYVVVHEMVHLLEPSHNKRFYQLMNQFLPDLRNHKKRVAIWANNRANALG